VSKPKGRDVIGRFTNGQAAIDGAYCSGATTPLATSTELDVAWRADPAPLPDAPPVSGYVARVALVLPMPVLCEQIALFAGEQPPVGYAPLLRSVCMQTRPGTVSSTQDAPQPTGFSWLLCVTTPYSRCDGDIDCDFDVDAHDLATLLSVFGSRVTPYG